MSFVPKSNSKWYYGIKIILKSCRAVCDALYCWPQTTSGLIVRKRCSDLFKVLYSDIAGYLEGHATRECLVGEIWADGRETNYSECTNSVRMHLEEIEEDGFLVPMVKCILSIESIISLVGLGISLAIFYSFGCDLVTVKIHFMVSLVVRFLLMLIITEPQVIGHRGSFRDVEFLCESVLVLFVFSMFASVSWMLIQGIFLNAPLMVGVITISAGYQLIAYYVVGWGIPTAFIMAYVISMLLRQQERCWIGYSDMDEMWILHIRALFRFCGLLQV